MTSWRRTLVALCCVFAGELLPVHGYGEEYAVSVGFDYSSGSYGTGTTSRNLYLPVALTWFINQRLDAGIEIPVLYQSTRGSGNYRAAQAGTSVATPVAKDVSGGSAVAMQQMPGSSQGGHGGSGVGGLGDILLRMGVIVSEEGAFAPQLRTSCSVKLPTASSSDGLGTGQFDVSGGLDAGKWFGSLHLLADGLFTYQGKADGLDLRNYFSYSAGAGYRVTDQLEPQAIIKGSTAASDVSGDQLEVRSRLLWNVTDSTIIDMYLSRGLTSSSPAYGGGLAVVFLY